MKIVLFPLDAYGSGHLRMAWPAAAVADQRLVDVTLVMPERRQVRLHLDVLGKVIREEFPLEAGDVAVFARASADFLPDAIHLLQARGVGVVVDMDDDLSVIHPRNPAWLLYHPRSSSGHSWQAAAACCQLADLVTTSTASLARVYGRHGRVAVVPNCVPADYLNVTHRDSAEIGWAGQVQSHPDDLQQMGGAIANLVRAGHVFRTVGEPRGVAEALGLSAEPPSTGPVSLTDYPAAVAQFGIGVAPLALTRFNTSKSWLKPLEYAALGVPWVASPTDDYRALHARGCGLIAERPRQWEATLRRLAGDDVARKDLSEAGRTVAAELTIEGNAWRWAEAWASAART